MDRIFYNTGVYDVPKGVPIYIFDTSFLPSPEIINYDEFIPTLMSLLPRDPYTLIMFSSGLNKISWTWGIKFLKKFLVDENNLNNIHKILSVHDGWFVKSLTSILSNYNLTKKNINVLNRLLESFDLSDKKEEFNLDSKIINCDNLAQLNDFIDITKLKISLNVYKHDYHLESTSPLINIKAIDFKQFNSMNFIMHKQDDFDSDDSFISTESSHETETGMSDGFKFHFYQIFNIIFNYGDKVELLFHKPGNKVNSEIFYNCIKRNQILWINDWDLHCIATCFRKLINELPGPLIKTELIELPIREQTLSHSLHKVLSSLIKDFQILLIQLFNVFNKLVKNNSQTKLTPTILAKNFVICLSHEVYLKANESNLIIVNNFIKKLIENWDHINHPYKSLTIDQILSGKDIENSHDDSYSHFDLTYEDVNDNNTTNTPDSDLESMSILSDSPKKNILGANSNIVNQSLPSTPKRKSPSKNIQLTRETSPNRGISTETSPIRSPTKVLVQYPPQKYKFDSIKVSQQEIPSLISPEINSNTKKPVIRGRKVGELARLYEERTQGLELLKGL